MMFLSQFTQFSNLVNSFNGIHHRLKTEELSITKQLPFQAAAFCLCGNISGAAFTIERTNQPLPGDDVKAIETGYVLLSEEHVEKLFTDQNEQVQKMRQFRLEEL